MPRKVHPHVCTHPPQSPDRTPRIVCRDCLALLNLLAVLRASGFEDGDPIVDLALRPGAKPRNRTPIESRYGRGDLICRCTRLPLDDDHEVGPRKQLRRAHTALEHYELTAARSWLAYLDRAEMGLAPRLRKLLPPGFESRSHITFSQRMWAAYRRLNGEKGKRGVERRPAEPRTAAFVLNVAELWEQGPSLICVFAMDAAAAVGWSGILRYRHPEWVTTPGFRMVELTLTRLPDYIEDARFGLEWKEETLIHVAA